MGKGNFSEEFMRDAARQITERWHPVMGSCWVLASILLMRREEVWAACHCYKGMLDG